MSRGLWIFAALFAILAISVIYQSEFGGGVERPWTECKENLFSQMISGECTPRSGGFVTAPDASGSGTDPQASPDSGTGSGDGLNSPLVQQR